MDWAYMGRLGMSALIFAPGLVILAMTLVIGILMLLEKAGVLARVSRAPLATPAGSFTEAPAANPAPSGIVAGLNAAVGGRKARASRKRA